MITLNPTEILDEDPPEPDYINDQMPEIELTPHKKGPLMVRDLKPHSRVDEIKVTIVAKEPARFVQTKNFTGLRAVAVGRDVTGEVKITLWDQEAYEVELGDKILILKGHCGQWLGDRILSTGKFGRLSIINEEY